MEEIIVQELQKELKLSYNICFDKIIQVESGIEIIKSKNNTSSHSLLNEINNISTVLSLYSEYLEFFIAKDKISINFKLNKYSV